MHRTFPPRRFSFSTKRERERERERGERQGNRQTDRLKKRAKENAPYHMDTPEWSRPIAIRTAPTADLAGVKFRVQDFEFGG